MVLTCWYLHHPSYSTSYTFVLKVIERKIKIWTIANQQS